MNRFYVITFEIVAALWMSAPAWSQEANPDRLTVTWSDPSRPGLVKVNIMNGSVAVKTHAGRDVIIDAKARSRTSRRTPAEAGGLRRLDMNTMGLAVEEENNVMSITTRDFSRSADIEIQVPAKTNLNLKSMNGGNITVDGVEGEIEVTNMNGSVTVNNVAGSVIAHSMNGKVVASLREATPQKPMAFTSMNGNIDVTLPNSIKANLKMRTDNGEIYSDFDVQLRPTNTQPTVQDSRSRGGRFKLETDKNMYGTVNGGGAEFDLRTLNGNIYIRKGT